MKKIILSLLMIVGIGSTIVIGSTGAFFSDTETSSGNTFTAGAIDLKVDNESYYNGVLNPGTTWEADELNNGALTIHKFFDFLDLKPDDYGEDTISLHVDTNDAYLCADITLTSDNDNTQTEPEALVDTNALVEGELADLVNFIWWADDGDNVLESDENVISQGPIGALTLNQPFPITLADSETNIWTVAGPIPGDTTLYIGKAWCFGAIGTAPIGQDGVGNLMSPDGNNNNDQELGTPEDGGITCNGSGLGNESQTDSLTADISFEAVQARHNDGFLCEGDCEINTQITLIPDSGFETPEVTASQQWDVFNSPAGAWNVAWRDDVPVSFGSQTRPNPARLEIHEGVLGAAFEGDQYTELDSDWGGPTDSGTGEPASVMIYQDITTVPGRAYQIRFAFAARPNTPDSENRLEVRWGGLMVHDTGNVADANAGIEWSNITVNVTATTTTTRLSFTDLGTANSMGTFLDAISLYGETCAPN